MSDHGPTLKEFREAYDALDAIRTKLDPIANDYTLEKLGAVCYVLARASTTAPEEEG